MNPSGQGGPLRVLFVNHIGRTSGAEESLLALLAALDRERVAARLACPPGPLAERAAALGVETASFPRLRLRWSGPMLGKIGHALAGLRAARRLRALRRAPGYDLVHANSTPAQLAAATALATAAVPLVWHARDIGTLHGLGRVLGARASRIIAISGAVRDNLVAQGIRIEKCEIIPNGIDPDAFAARAREPLDRAALGLAADDRLIVMAGQFVPWKRHEDFIRAMARIAVRVPKARALILGSDLFDEHRLYRADLERLAREIGVAGRVIFAGQRDDVAAILQASAAVVMPSEAEPFGRVALEAMALGRPVVATRAGGVPELITDNETGLLVPPRDWRALADAVVKVLRYDDFAGWIGCQAAARVREHFHIRDHARRVMDLYDALTAEKGGGACASA